MEYPTGLSIPCVEGNGRLWIATLAAQTRNDERKGPRTAVSGNHLHHKINGKDTLLSFQNGSGYDEAVEGSE
jgi:hypothetical protein